MQFKKYTKAQMPFLALLTIAFVLASCGSSQYVSEDNDGIYGTSQEPVANNDVAKDDNSLYYKNYFKEKATEYDYITEEEAVFTDIDSYEGNYVEQESNTEQQSYAGWGQDNNDVTINVYSNFGGYGYNNWYRPYGYGYYGFSPYWNTGWGYSGFYDPFWCSPYYGYGGYYHSPYWNNYGYNNYYGRNSVAYHNSRRGNNLNRYNSITRRSSAISGRNTTRSRVQTTSTRRGSTTATQNNTRTRTNTSTRPRIRTNTSTTTKPRVKSTRSNTNTTRTTRPRTNSYSTPRSSSSRSSSATRSSSSRSSSSTRSSSSSRRR